MKLANLSTIPPYGLAQLRQRVRGEIDVRLAHLAEIDAEAQRRRSVYRKAAHEQAVRDEIRDRALTAHR